MKPTFAAWVPGVAIIYLLCYTIYLLTAGFTEPELLPDYTEEIPQEQLVLAPDTVSTSEPVVKPIKRNGGDALPLFLLKFEKIPGKRMAAFTERFLNTAIVESYKYNIPIAISLAQGIVESACGESELSIRANNFFGIKCRERCKTCSGKKWQIVGNCINAHDDSKHDLFRMHATAWESWRTHSTLLVSNRYKHLTKLHITDYKTWAHGLRAAGYATNPQYGPVLIRYIKDYNLDQFDRMDIQELARARGLDLSKVKKHNISK